jgi:hypothetical protein
MILPTVMSLALSAIADVHPKQSYCAFPTAAPGGKMLELRVQRGADRNLPNSRSVWLGLGETHRIRGRIMVTTEGEAPSLVITSDDLQGELTLSLRIDGRASLFLLAEGEQSPVERRGRCGGVASLMAAPSPR